MAFSNGYHDMSCEPVVILEVLESFDMTRNWVIFLVGK